MQIRTDNLQFESSVLHAHSLILLNRWTEYIEAWLVPPLSVFKWFYFQYWICSGTLSEMWHMAGKCSTHHPETSPKLLAIPWYCSWNSQWRRPVCSQWSHTVVLWGHRMGDVVFARWKEVDSLDELHLVSLLRTFEIVSQKLIIKLSKYYLSTDQIWERSDENVREIAERR